MISSSPSRTTSKTLATNERGTYSHFENSPANDVERFAKNLEATVKNGGFGQQNPLSLVERHDVNTFMKHLADALCNRPASSPDMPVPVYCANPSLTVTLIGNVIHIPLPNRKTCQIEFTGSLLKICAKTSNDEVAANTLLALSGQIDLDQVHDHQFARQIRIRPQINTSETGQNIPNRMIDRKAAETVDPTWPLWQTSENFPTMVQKVTGVSSSVVSNMYLPVFKLFESFADNSTPTTRRIFEDFAYENADAATVRSSEKLKQLFWKTDDEITNPDRQDNRTNYALAKNAVAMMYLTYRCEKMQINAEEARQQWIDLLSHSAQTGAIKKYDQRPTRAQLVLAKTIAEAQNDKTLMVYLKRGLVIFEYSESTIQQYFLETSNFSDFLAEHSKSTNELCQLFREKAEMTKDLAALKSWEGFLRATGHTDRTIVRLSRSVFRMHEAYKKITGWLQ